MRLTVQLILGALILTVLVIPIQAKDWPFYYPGDQFLEWAEDWESIRTYNFQGAESIVIKRFANSQRYEGFISGFLQGTSTIKSYPPNVSAEQVYRVVYKYLKDHPEELHLPATQLIRKAVVGAFEENESYQDSADNTDQILDLDRVDTDLWKKAEKTNESDKTNN